MTFGMRLKSIRAKAGMTQGGLSDASGVSVNTIREYEQHKRRPLLENAVKLARALGVGVEAFTVEDEPEEKKTNKEFKHDVRSIARDRSDSDAFIVAAFGNGDNESVAQSPAKQKRGKK